MTSVGRAARLLLVLALGAAALALPAAPAAAVPSAPTTQEPVAYLVADASTGTILSARNEHQPLLPASTIKLLTALSVLERLPMASTVPVSARAASQPAMKISMTEGSVWPLDQALHSLLIVSANDAAYALAERTSGSVEQFALDTQATAERLGMQDTTFRDPAGLDDRQSYGGGSRTSAYDLAITARNALAVPEIATILPKLTYEFTDPNGVGRRLVNHNRGFLTGYPGATGMKTGYTEAASRTLVTSATRGGHTLVAVVMGTWDDTGWAGYLLDQGFATPTSASSTGTSLPEVRISTADGRLAAFSGLPPALGMPALGTGPTPAAAPATRAPEADRVVEVDAHRTEAAVGTARAVPTGTAGDTAGGFSIGAWLSLRNMVVVVVALLLTLFFLRRRAVRRQRIRRLARQRALAEARRRRMIDVVDREDDVAGVRPMPASDRHPSMARHRASRPNRRLPAGRPR